MEQTVKQLQEKYPYAINEYTESNEVIIIVGENYQWVKADRITVFRPCTRTLSVRKFEGNVECSPLMRNIPEKYKHLPVLFWSI